MSYIRCTSNPENLYVWGDIDGYVHWNTNDILIRIPQATFDGLMNKVAQQGGYVGMQKLKYRGAKLYEFFQDDNTELFVTPQHRDNCKIVLEYEGQEHRIWLVTFEHIFNSWARNNFRYHIREAYWCFRRMIPWWVNPRYWFSK
jgi:hypothetical protein